MLIPPDSFQPMGGSRFISREHWVMWQPEVLGFYVRAGRFFAPYGLRVAEHVLYIRRDTGFNTLQETYNLSGGFIFENAELHATLFGPDVVRHIGSDQKGAAIYYEHRVASDKVALAGQARLSFDPGGETRSMFGGVAKGYVEPIKTLFMGEVDVVEIDISDRLVSARNQVIGAGGFTAFPYKGLMLTLLGEVSKNDVETSGSGWTAGTLLFNWFPYAHTELQLLGRLQFPAGMPTAKTFLAQLHYFL
jgi:hypothetical protein